MFAPIILWAGITDNSFGLTIEEKNAMLITGSVIFSIVIILCAVAAIIIIAYSNIDKKWKLILSFSWIIFTPIYLIIYYTKFQTIFSKKLEKKTYFNLDKLNVTSFISFVAMIVLIISLIMTFVLEKILSPQSYNKDLLLGIFGITLLLSFITYTFTYSISLYLSMYSKEQKISCPSKIPFACSFVWMYSKKIIKE